MLMEQGEQAGSKGSELAVSLSFREVPGAQGCSGSKGGQAGSEGSKLGAREVSWRLSKAPRKFQGPRYAQGARAVSWEQGE